MTDQRGASSSSDEGRSQTLDEGQSYSDRAMKHLVWSVALADLHGSCPCGQSSDDASRQTGQTAEKSAP
ncbi:MAG: hypothetical protein JWO69_2015 [Thermoleophilia bacterium]|nr:hypothetical protein [Thermoleophilia bacterium]